jgi:predicted nucleotidyltransferase
MIKEELINKIRDASEEVNQNFAIKSVKLFGSRASDTARADSDVDLIIEFSSGTGVGLFAMVEIENIFQRFLKLKTDITTPAGLDELIRDRVLKKAETVYER